MTTVLLKNFIDGHYVNGDESRSFDVRYPASGEVIYRVEQAGEAMMLQAIKSAKRGFEQ